MPENLRSSIVVEQIICFIDPGKFQELLLNAQKKDGLKLSKDRIILNNDNLVYIGENEIETSNYDADKANKSKCLLVPDSFKLQYIPAKAFKILYHNGTTNRDLINELRNNKFYTGERKSIEEIEAENDKNKESLYYIIAKNIRDLSINEITEQIPYYDVILETKLELLHACLTPEGARNIYSIDNIDLIEGITVNYSINKKEKNIKQFISEHLAIKSDCFSDTYIESLSCLRIALLGA